MELFTAFWLFGAFITCCIGTAHFYSGNKVADFMFFVCSIVPAVLLWPIMLINVLVDYEDS